MLFLILEIDILFQYYILISIKKDVNGFFFNYGVYSFVMEVKVVQFVFQQKIYIFLLICDIDCFYVVYCCEEMFDIEDYNNIVIYN